MAGLTVDQLSASVDARLDNNSQNLLLWSGSFEEKLQRLGLSPIDSINDFTASISASFTELSSSVNTKSASFNSRINRIDTDVNDLSIVTNDNFNVVNNTFISLNAFSASITSSFNSLSASVSSTSASFSTRINTLRADAGGVSTADFNALTQSLSGVISSSAQLNNATITNLTITNLTTINETASVVFSSGSNQFGDALNDTQILSGSVYIVGSGSLNGYTLLTSNNTSSFLTSLNGALSSSAQVLNGSGIFSSSAQLPAGLISSSINTGSFATTGSNAFNGTQTITGSLIVSGSGDALFVSGGQIVRLGRASLYTGTGAYDGNVFLQGLQTKLYADKVVLEAASGLGVEVIGNTKLTGSMTISSSAAVDLNVIGALNVTGSLKVSDSILATGTAYPLSISHGTGTAKEYSIAIGHNALISNTSGESNVAVGWASLLRNTTGQSITAIGNNAGYNNTTGTRGTYIGYAAGYTNTTGVDNTLLGYQAGYGISTGGYNTSVGENTLFNNNGSNNVALGMNAGQYSSGSSESNVYIGYQAGPSVATTESNKLYINNNNGSPLIGGDFSAKSVTISGSLLMSGSIIPAVGTGTSTSSFSLGSATNAWKDLWVSNGTINFLGADGTPQGTLSSTATGLQLGSSTISGSMVITGSLTIVNALGNGQKVLGANGILGANYIAGNSGYLGVENGFTRSVQPIISSYFTNYYTTINNAPYKWEMADLGIGSTYSWNYGRFTPSPAIRVGHNTDLSFYTGSSSNIYVPGFSTIISSNNNLSGLERNETVAYSNGINHVLAVTGSLLSRDNTTLGTKATDLTYIRGAATISGSLVVTGSLTVSSSAAVDVKVIGKTDLTGSLFMTSSGLEYAKFETNRFSVFSSGGFWLELGSANNGLSIQDFGDATQGTWFTTEQPLKLMGPVTQLSALNGDPGIVNVIGKMNVTGSVVLVPQGAPTSPASGSLYFSSADSHFYGWNGLVWKQLDN